QEMHISQQSGLGTDEGTGSKPGVLDVPSNDSEEELSWNSSDDEEGDEQTKGREESEGDKTDESDDESDDGSDDETVKAGSESDKDDDDNDDEEELAKKNDEDTESGKGGDEVNESEGESDEEETRQEEEESFDLIPRTPEGREDESNDEEDHELRLSEEARIQEEEDADELYRDESSSMSSFVTSMLNPTSDVGVESIFTTTSSPIVSLQNPTPIMTPFTIATITTSGDAPIPPTTIPSIILENLLTFNSAFRFEERLRSLENTFFKYRQTNPFVDAVSAIPGIVHQYMTQQMTEAVREAALVEAYDADKAILDTYGESTILKRRQEDDDQEGPSAGSDRGYKRQKEGGEHASASTPSETTTRGAGRSTTGSQSRQLSISESAFAEEPVQTTCQMEEPPHPVFETGADDQPIVQTSQHPESFSQPRRPPSLDRDWNKTLPAAQGDAQSWISDLARQTDARSSFNELLDTPIDFSNFIMNRLNPLSLIPDNRGRRVIPFDHFINNDLEYLRGGASSRKYTTSVTKTKAADYGHIKWIEDLVPRAMWIHQPIDYNRHALWGVSHWGRKRQQFYGYAVNRESALDVYSKRRIIAVTKLKIVEWHDYKHLDWISVRRDDDQIYKFKEGDFKRLHLQDIKDMLLLLEHCHPEASGRSSTRSEKLPEEDQPYKARHVPTRSEAM
nr:hypothetical protein [Tanacetum cinerariifolium]